MTKRSPNLEVISNSSNTDPAASTSGEDSRMGSERRRLPRLFLATEQFRLKANGKIFPVLDLSNEGMGLGILDRADLVLFTPGIRIEGHLNLAGTKYLLRAQVRHLRQDFVGCQFEDISESCAAALRNFLDPQRLGSELRLIPAPANEKLVWYHAASGADFLVWPDSQGNFQRLSLFVFGSYVQWDADSGLVTGRTQADSNHSEVAGILRLQTLVLQSDERPDAAKLEVAKTLLLSSNLPQELKGWSLQKIRLES